MTPEELAMLAKEQSFSTLGTINEQGTGFGLRISKEIIALLNGSVNIESKFGVGDITGKSSIEFWTKLKKSTTKWNPEAGVNWMS